MTANKVRHILLLALLPVSLINAGCAIGEAARKNASYHYQMGLSYLGENNVTGALVELTEAEKLTPDDPELQFNLGRAYFRKNHFDLAEKRFVRAIVLKPEFSEAKFNLGLTYLQMKRWDDAIYQFSQVNEDIFYQNQELASINLGIAYLSKGEYPRALSTLRTAVNCYPRNPIAKVYLGQVYLALNKVELAIIEFNRALELSKHYANAYYNRGQAYLKNKDNQAAVASFREALRIAPDSEIGQHSREYIDLLK